MAESNAFSNQSNSFYYNNRLNINKTARSYDEKYSFHHRAHSNYKPMHEVLEPYKSVFFEHDSSCVICLWRD